VTDLVCPPEGSPPGSLDAADDAVVAELRRAAALADPVPGAWRAAARDAYEWRGAPGEPARLVYEAQAPGDAGADRTPARDVRRSLRFVADGWGNDARIELDLERRVDALGLTGRLRPARAARVTVVVDRHTVTVEADDDGGFRFDDVPPRPFHLLVGGVIACKTGWVVP
jgi:hypothetical protein